MTRLEFVVVVLSLGNKKRNCGSQGSAFVFKYGKTRQVIVAKDRLRLDGAKVWFLRGFAFENEAGDWFLIFDWFLDQAP